MIKSAKEPKERMFLYSQKSLILHALLSPGTTKSWNKSGLKRPPHLAQPSAQGVQERGSRTSIISVSKS